MRKEKGATNTRLLGLLAVMALLAGVAGYVWYNRLRQEGVIGEPHDPEATTVKYEEFTGLTAMTHGYGADAARSGPNVRYHLTLNFFNQSDHEVSGASVRFEIYGPGDDKPKFTTTQWFGGFFDGRTYMRDVLMPNSMATAMAMYDVPEDAYATLQTGGRWEWHIEEVMYFNQPKDLKNAHHLFALIARGDFHAYKDAADADPSLLELREERGDARAVHVAAAYDEVDALAYLHGRGAQLNPETRSGINPLMLAAMNSSLQAVSFLLSKGFDIDAKDGAGLTALHYAARKPAAEAAQELLRAGADVDAKDAEGKTPLYHSMATGELDIVKVLLDNGADVNSTDAAGRNPIHAATFSGNLDVVKELVRRKAKLDGADQDGFTVLHYAAAGGDEEIVKYVASLRIDKSKRDSMGRTAQDIAYDAGHEEVAKYLRP